MPRPVRRSPLFTGFTLIELLIVIAILGVLAVFGITNYKAALIRSRDAQRISDLRNIQTALRLYFNDFNGYPASTAGGKIVGCGVGDPAVACNWGEAWVRHTNTYMSTLPADPATGHDSYYYTQVSTDNYTLAACLENLSSTKCAPPQVQAVWCASGCIYTVEQK